ncbi:MAG: ammonia channel protein [Betaproteobacteria bacterium TMED156]|nr:MAG: ammonia channel protein [Betaproteobacteria bacterium TMED156]
MKISKQALGLIPMRLLGAIFAMVSFPVLAQDPEIVEEVVAAAEPLVFKGDVAWMMTATLLVTFMAIPGLALFYGGLVRTKNMLSMLMQVTAVFCLIVVLWAIYGYSLALTEGNAIIGGMSQLFLGQTTIDSTAGTFTDGIVLPETIFIAFQSTFAGLTCALIVGSMAERAKFAGVLLFAVIWFTLSYLPICHMVWGPGGYLLDKGALDFAGGTVVHINSGIAGLVAAYVLGKRMGYGKEAMPPHSLPMTLIGAAILWVGWFGFNAGSNLEATSGATLPFANTLFATCAAILAWTIGESISKGKPSMLGAASGMISGLVAITPACGSVGIMGAIIIGAIAGFVCLWACTGLKSLLGADESLDVFGIHGVGGILGAILTGVFTAPTLGGTGGDDFSIGGQVFIQLEAVIITIIVSAVAAFIALKVADLLVGIRVSEDDEREGLDVTSHSEKAYYLN